MFRPATPVADYFLASGAAIESGLLTGDAGATGVVEFAVSGPKAKVSTKPKPAAFCLAALQDRAEVGGAVEPRPPDAEHDFGVPRNDGWPS